MSKPFSAAIALEKMMEIRQRQDDGWSDREGDHVEADDILCEMLQSLGYAQIVSEFHAIKKWYA